jgi:hypothetical protein
MSAMKELDLILQEYDEARELAADKDRGSVALLVQDLDRLINAADALVDTVRWMTNVQPPRTQHQRGPDCRCEECRRDFPTY